MPVLPRLFAASLPHAHTRACDAHRACRPYVTGPPMTRPMPFLSRPTRPSTLAPAAASAAPSKPEARLLSAATAQRPHPCPSAARRVAKMAKEKKAKELKDKKEQQARPHAPDGFVAVLASERPCAHLPCPRPLPPLLPCASTQTPSRHPNSPLTLTPSLTLSTPSLSLPTHAHARPQQPSTWGLACRSLLLARATHDLVGPACPLPSPPGQGAQREEGGGEAGDRAGTGAADGRCAGAGAGTARRGGAGGGVELGSCGTRWPCGG